MAVDYRHQYKPNHLEPFFPNEIIKMAIVVLCTMALLMFLVVLPTLLDTAGIENVFHEEQPADPTVTPPHVRPEWYFLAVYQYLKLMPQEWLGMDGKALGILTQTVVIGMVVMLPFWFPIKSVQLDAHAWARGLRSFCLLLGFFLVPAVALAWVRSTLTPPYNDLIHPMFVWPVCAIFAYVAAGAVARQRGFADAFKWLNLFSIGLALIGLQYLAFLVVLGQGLSWTLPATLAYTIGAIPFLAAVAFVIRFIVLRARGKDKKLRLTLLTAFVTEGIILFMGLTIWAMWPAGGLYGEHGWHHEAKGFGFSLLIIAAATVILFAFLVTERRTVEQTLAPDERDKIT